MHRHDLPGCSHGNRDCHKASNHIGMLKHCLHRPGSFIWGVQLSICIWTDMHFESCRAFKTAYLRTLRPTMVPFASTALLSSHCPELYRRQVQQLGPSTLPTRLPRCQQQNLSWDSCRFKSGPRKAMQICKSESRRFPALRTAVPPQCLCSLAIQTLRLRYLTSTRAPHTSDASKAPLPLLCPKIMTSTKCD